MDTAQRVADVFLRRFGNPAAGIARAPGRVNLLGEHVDYNDGFVLPIATDLATYAAFAPSQSSETTLWADDLKREIRFTTETLRDKHSADGRLLPAWALYPAGVAWSLAEAGHETHGLKTVYASDVPTGAGLSSSASVELAFALAWASVSSVSLPGMELARLCQHAENAFVGVNCGIMDQAASACSQVGQVMVLDCRSLEYQSLPLPSDVVVVVADTGVRHTLADGVYNQRRQACEQAVGLLREQLPGIIALRDVSVEDFDRCAPGLPPEIEMRARHVVEEIDRTRRAVESLRSHDMHSFGLLMNASHASLRDLYEVSCAELDTMVTMARALPGCFGSRLTGAGFGGCTVSLVQKDLVEPFMAALADGYAAAAGREPRIYLCTASGGASLLNA